MPKTETSVAVNLEGLFNNSLIKEEFPDDDLFYKSEVGKQINYQNQSIKTIHAQDFSYENYKKISCAQHIQAECWKVRAKELTKNNDIKIKEVQSKSHLLTDESCVCKVSLKNEEKEKSSYKVKIKLEEFLEEENFQQLTKKLETENKEISVISIDTEMNILKKTTPMSTEALRRLDTLRILKTRLMEEDKKEKRLARAHEMRRLKREKAEAERNRIIQIRAKARAQYLKKYPLEKNFEEEDIVLDERQEEDSSPSKTFKINKEKDELQHHKELAMTIEECVKKARLEAPRLDLYILKRAETSGGSFFASNGSRWRQRINHSTMLSIKDCEERADYWKARAELEREQYTQIIYPECFKLNEYSSSKIQKRNKEYLHQKKFQKFKIIEEGENQQSQAAKQIRNLRVRQSNSEHSKINAIETIHYRVSCSRVYDGEKANNAEKAKRTRISAEREKSNQLNEEEKTQLKKVNIEMQLQKRQNDEKKIQRNAITAQRMHQHRQEMSQEERDELNDIQEEIRRQKRAELSPEERAKINAIQTEIICQRRAVRLDR